MIIDGLVDGIPDWLPDVCIIGAGAAGVAIASEFVDDDVRVLLLESGSDSYSPGLQRLYDGDLDYSAFGGAYRSGEALARDRVRIFGGTTNHWGGMCAPLDHLDFTVRPWIHDSGWPLTRMDLLPFYDRASSYLKIPKTRHFDNEELSKNEVEFLEGSVFLRSKYFHMSRVGNFGFNQRERLKNSRNVMVVQNANVSAINVAPNDIGNIESVSVYRGFDRNEKILLRARCFVLATGAIENARILLNSNSRFPRGIGNAHDNVGRYFQGHGYSRRLAIFAIRDGSRYVRPFETGGGDGLRLVAPTDRLQRDQEINNFWIGINAFADEVAWPDTEFVDPVLRHLEHLYGYASNSSHGWYVRACQVFFEQEPSRDSRVTLVEEVDELGMRRVSVRAPITQLQWKTFKAAVHHLGIELGSRNIGRVMLPSSESGFMASIEDGLGKHHHGTTRMSLVPRFGVVDQNCKVHDLNNLYVTGASVFPTSGAANPTFTIVALALRLADHLKIKLKEGV